MRICRHFERIFKSALLCEICGQIDRKCDLRNPRHCAVCLEIRPPVLLGIRSHAPGSRDAQLNSYKQSLNGGDLANRKVDVQSEHWRRFLSSSPRPWLPEDQVRGEKGEGKNCHPVRRNPNPVFQVTELEASFTRNESKPFPTQVGFEEFRIAIINLIVGWRECLGGPTRCNPGWSALMPLDRAASR